MYEMHKPCKYSLCDHTNKPSDYIVFSILHVTIDNINYKNAFCVDILCARSIMKLL